MSTPTNTTKERVIKLLSRGLARPIEAARLSGESRQTCEFWAKAAKLDTKAARETFLTQAWAETLDPPTAFDASYREIIDALVKVYGQKASADIRGKIAYALATRINRE